MRSSVSARPGRQPRWWFILGASMGAWVQANEPEMIVWTETTEQGRAWLAPSREAPTYYQAINVGYQTYAGAIGGDFRPPDDEFLQLVLQQLAAQGYLPSNDGHPPTIVLGFSWGDLRGNFAGALRFLAGDDYNLLGFVDPQRYGLPPPVTSGDRFRTFTLASEPLYVVTIAAYDWQEATVGRAVKLWQTRIACPQRGFYAKDALPKILVAGAPLIGRPTPMPVWMEPTRSNRRTEVQIGELTTIGAINPDEAVLLDLPKALEAARDK